VAWSADLGGAPVDPEVRRITGAAAKAFVDLGCRVEEEHPPLGDAMELFMDLTAPMRAAGMAAHLPRWRDQLDPMLLLRLDRAEKMSAIDWERATHRRADVPAGDRRAPAHQPARMVPVHLSLRDHRPARDLGAGRIHRRGIAGGAADRRPAVRGCHRPARRCRLRGCAAVGGAATAAGLTCARLVVCGGGWSSCCCWLRGS
jgi:hypothetical protein